MKLLAHRGVHQTYSKEELSRDGYTANRIDTPQHPFSENTIESIQRAFSLGADVIEIDIHPTKDGQFAVIHDWTRDCRTNGEGTTRDHSRNFLESLLVVRVHLEYNNIRNGALHVIPGSHIEGNVETSEIICEVKKGGALVMRPIILHKSRKLQSGSRRVLHFVFGPENLPDGAEWPLTVVGLKA